MADEARTELARLWEQHLAAQFSYEWHELEERFGDATDRAELRAVADGDRLLEAWGGPDLRLYDTYVAGHISTILTGRRAGAEVLGESRPDERLAHYFELCLAEATDEKTREKIEFVPSLLRALEPDDRGRP